MSVRSRTAGPVQGLSWCTIDHMPRPTSQVRAAMRINALMLQILVSLWLLYSIQRCDAYPWLETAAPEYEIKKTASIKMTSRHETICIKSTATLTALIAAPVGSSTSSGRGVSRGVSSLAIGVVDSRGRDLGLVTMLRFRGGGRVPLRMSSVSSVRNDVRMLMPVADVKVE